MVKKFVFGNLLLAGIFLFTAPASASLEDGVNTLHISAKKLKIGYEQGEVSLKNGTRVSVANKTNGSEPRFEMLPNPKQKFTAHKEKDGKFHFRQYLRTVERDPTTGQWIESEATEIFDLVVKLKKD